MNSRYKRLTIGTSLLVMFSLAQIYIGASFAGSDPPPGRPRVVGRSTAGTLVTSGKQAILVNGIRAVTDATIMSGASVQTPQNVSATINLAGLGRLNIAPSTSLKLDFSDGRIRVTLFKGCVVLYTKGSTIGTIETPNGVVGGTRDTSKGSGLDVCQPDDGAATPLVNQGAAANAGAGASGGSGAGATSGSGASASSAGAVQAGASGGMSPALSVFIAASLIIPMTVAAIVLNNCDHGTNPSPELNTQCL